ncbi:MAG: hypothetical protein ACOCUT_03915 [bacterium]
MEKRNFLTTIFLILSLTMNLFGQGTFKKYKDEKTGKITAWADGVYLMDKVKCKQCGKHYRCTKENTSKKYCSEYCKTKAEEKRKKAEEEIKKIGGYYPSYSYSDYSFSYRRDTYLYPSYNGGSYYLILEDYDIDCQFDCYYYIYIALNNRDKILTLVAKAERNNNTFNWEDLKFKIQSQDLIQMALAQNIEILVSDKKLYKYESFSYSYDFTEFASFRQFAEGMKLISKD